MSVLVKVTSLLNAPVVALTDPTEIFGVPLNPAAVPDVLPVISSLAVMKPAPLVS